MKTFLLALIAGIAGAVAGYVVAAFAAMLFAMATGMSNFEGAAGMFAAFAVGPIGGLIGLILGIVIVLRRRAPRAGFGTVAVRGVLAVVAIAAMVSGGIGVAYLMRDTVNPNGPAPRLMFDLKLPPGTAGDAKTLTVELHTDRNVMPGLVFDRPERRDGDRVVVSGSVELYFRTSQRVLVVKRKGELDRLFRLKLSANPGHMREQSAWQAVDLAAGPGEKPRKPGLGDTYELRYRVAWAGED